MHLSNFSMHLLYGKMNVVVDRMKTEHSDFFKLWVLHM